MTFSGSCYLKLPESYMMPGRAPKHIWFQLPLPCGSCLQRPQRPRPQEALWAALAFFPPHPSALELCRTLTGVQANLFMPFRSFYHLGCFWLCSGFLLLLNKKPRLSVLKKFIIVSPGSQSAALSWAFLPWTFHVVTGDDSAHGTLFLPGGLQHKETDVRNKINE